MVQVHKYIQQIEIQTTKTSNAWGMVLEGCAHFKFLVPIEKMITYEEKNKRYAKICILG